MEERREGARAGEGRGGGMGSRGHGHRVTVTPWHPALRFSCGKCCRGRGSALWAGTAPPASLWPRVPTLLPPAPPAFSLLPGTTAASVVWWGGEEDGGRRRQGCLGRQDTQKSIRERAALGGKLHSDACSSPKGSQTQAPCHLLQPS